jgi:hypothetical protein
MATNSNAPVTPVSDLSQFGKVHKNGVRRDGARIKKIYEENKNEWVYINELDVICFYCLCW